MQLPSGFNGLVYGTSSACKTARLFPLSSEDEISFSKTQLSVSGETRTKELSVSRVKSNTLPLNNCAPYPGTAICSSAGVHMVQYVFPVHLKADHYRSAFKWRFAGGPMVARDCMLAELWINTYLSQQRVHQGYSAYQTGSWPTVYKNKAEISIKPE